MANWGRVKPVTVEVGGKIYTYRSKLEYRWAVWCQLRKEQGIIFEWEYESVEVPLKYKTGEVKIYRPDFTIMDAGLPRYEETKGWFTSKDYTKMKLMSKQYDNPLTLIFANLKNTKSARLQYGRAKRLEKLLESNGGRVIFEANKTIFRKIKHLFTI